MEPLEVHLTLQAHPSHWEAVRLWASRASAKFIWIELEQGECCQQPMVTWWQTGDLSAILERVAAVETELMKHHVHVARVKTECGYNHSVVPTEPQHLTELNVDLYFEHHVKLVLPEQRDRKPLLEIASRHSGHLSRNAFRKRDDGMSERFLTQRCYRTIRRDAAEQLEALLIELRKDEYEIVEVEREYVLYDSNQSIDKGWIPSLP